LFLIGAYRDNEVSPTHPLMMTLDGLNHNKIKLLPLSFQDLSKMLSDTLHCDEQEIGRLLLANTIIADNNFELVNHLNAGISLITDKIEQQKLAELNLIAAQKAKDTAAMQQKNM